MSKKKKYTFDKVCKIFRGKIYELEKNCLGKKCEDTDLYQFLQNGIPPILAADDGCDTDLYHAVIGLGHIIKAKEENPYKMAECVFMVELNPDTQEVISVDNSCCDIFCDEANETHYCINLNDYK